MTDNVDALIRDLALQKANLHRVENPESGAVAMFPTVPSHAPNSPEQRALENEWETRAILQTQQAERLTIENQPTRKPKQNAFADLSIIRGD